ncbi:MAG: response regulator transcription factor [Deltaproteobacteria bacterium]|nr:response regulator transcription factor [Deltaproteobacteria bacterium]
MKANYQIILAEDHVRFRGEIKKIINEIPGVELVGEVGEGHELFGLLETSRPDLVLLDISMPNLRGMQATRAIKSRYPEVKVILMLMDEETEYLSHAIAAGADGILLKQNSAMGLRSAIHKIRHGGRYFPGVVEEKRYGGDTGKINPFGGLTFLSF